MATTTEKKPRRKARQKAMTDDSGDTLNDLDSNIPELVTLGESLDEARTERIKAQAGEKDYEDRVVECMKKHDIMVFQMPDGRKLERTHEEKDRVKVRKPKQQGETDFGGE
jgi:hypothetical protein